MTDEKSHSSFKRKLKLRMEIQLTTELKKNYNLDAIFQVKPNLETTSTITA